MSTVIRGIEQDELSTFVRAVEAGFGEPDGTDENIQFYSRLTEVDRAVVAVRDGEFVGTAGAYTFEWTVPGPQLVSAAGVTAVTVRSDARRSGVLTKMMAAQLRDVAERGEPVAILEASEAIIYGRFGYGLCTTQGEIRVHKPRAQFRPDAPSGGRVRHVQAVEAGKVIPGVFNRVRRATIGDLSRSEIWWEEWFKDPRERRGGAGGRFYVVHENAKGKADGYAVYRVKGEWEDHNPKGTVKVSEVVAETVEAYAGLWRHLLDVDLATTVLAPASMDEPLRWLLADARQQTTISPHDRLWARILDVPAALQGRSYGTESSIVLEVVDTFGSGWAAGRYELSAGKGGAKCKRVRSKADLTLGVAELGVIYLGATPASTLGRAGRITENRAGALRRADLLFAADSAPFTRTNF